MPAPRHLAFPVTLAASGHLATNAQDTDPEIADCIAAVLAYPQGHRRGSPRFGIPPLLFDYPDLAALRAAVAANEPRCEYEVTLTDELLRKGIANINLGFDPSLGD